MPENGPRYMRLLIFFDLPVVAPEDRAAANRFRKFLKKSGFTMLQLSVYMRICRGQDMVDASIARVEKNVPYKGSVRALQVTDAQYARMKFMAGGRTTAEIDADNVILNL